MIDILHITSEITKKNFSIVSLIKFIVSNKSKSFKTRALCSNAETNNNFPKKYLTVEKIRWLDIFKLKIILNIISKYEIIHVHGIWAPIQLYSIILCVIESKKTVIHSHGMLLSPAINDHGTIKRIGKKLFLLFFKILISNARNITFVAITNEEYRTIKNLFPNAIVKLIPNNIPFKRETKNISSNIKYQKKFVFFGRVHPHKNISKLIQIFINSNLIKDGWKLEIYGILDDQNYLKKIQNMSSGYPNIKILKPVFGEKKAKIMREAWGNILISKSEVLSFSVLESATYGLPSIISNNIETLKDDNFSIRVNNNSYSLIRKINDIANCTINFRKKIGQKTLYFFKNYQIKSETNFLKNLSNFYLKIFRQRSEQKFNTSQESFYITSLVHSLNVFLPNIILILFFISFESKIAAEIGITNIIFITLTQVLAGNIRLISISTKDIDLLRVNLSYRLLLGILILIAFHLISFNFLLVEDFLTTFLISSLIILLWCSELVLSIYELRRNIGKLLISLFIYGIFIILLILTFLFKNIFLIQSILILSCLGLLYFCLFAIDFKINFNLIFKDIAKGKLDFLRYFSSLSFNLSSLCWRIYLYFSYSKEISGTIFIAFAICSFPGTFFNSVLGPAYFSNKISFQSKLKFLFLLIFIMLLLFNAFNFQTLNLNNLDSNNLFSHVLKISSLGSVLMFYAMYARQNSFFIRRAGINKLFYKDILYGATLVLILPFLDYYGGINLLVYSFLAGSIFAVLYFDQNYKKMFKK